VTSQYKKDDKKDRKDKAVRIKQSQIGSVRQSLMEKQNYRCAVCSSDFREYTIRNRKKVLKNVPCLDHDHNSGYIRGVLCRACNSIEGKFLYAMKRAGSKEDPLSLLLGLHGYLYEHRVNSTGIIHPSHKTDEEKRQLANKRVRQRRDSKKVLAALKDVK